MIVEECFLLGMPRPEKLIVENGEPPKGKYLPDNSYLLWHERTSNQKALPIHPKVQKEKA